MAVRLYPVFILLSRVTVVRRRVMVVVKPFYRVRTCFNLERVPVRTRRQRFVLVVVTVARNSALVTVRPFKPKQARFSNRIKKVRCLSFLRFTIAGAIVVVRVPVLLSRFR